jgi:hypothetical protein
MFALFMDWVVFPIVWLLSPNMRAHQRAVKLQNAHLRDNIHALPQRDCWYCRARVEDALGPAETFADPDWWQDLVTWNIAVAHYRARRYPVQH